MGYHGHTSRKIGPVQAQSIQQVWYRSYKHDLVSLTECISIAYSKEKTKVRQGNNV